MSIEVKQIELKVPELQSWLERYVTPLLTPDHSNYAKNRLRAWLSLEPPLGPTQPFRPAPNGFEPATRAMQKLINWRFDYWLITFSGEPAIGIEPHRDASYADYEAYGLNAVGTCKFSYWNDRQSFGRSASSGLAPHSGPPTHVINMVPGTLVRFNCKNLHSAVPGPNRWGFNFWKRKP